MIREHKVYDNSEIALHRRVIGSRRYARMSRDSNLNSCLEAFFSVARSTMSPMMDLLFVGDFFVVNAPREESER